MVTATTLIPEAVPPVIRLRVAVDRDDERDILWPTQPDEDAPEPQDLYDQLVQLLDSLTR